jgi:MraZ protein
MASFIGEFEQIIDAKHRMALPMALRERIVPATDGEDFVVMLGPDGHLWIYPNLAYERLQEALSLGPLPDRQSGHMTLVSAMAREMKADKQGRVVVPEKSMRRAGLKEQESVTLVGARDHIEVWPTAAWEEHLGQSLPNYGEWVYGAAERLQRDTRRSSPSESAPR